eukprot:TRINITY_DN11545_c0_g1_i5.p1 TRINITY_DN11545_c0_g1~~TRINITY_DN11545_c0_g1_i5.p1  ORF type:complete len:157 (+),score=24.86 TRINITY_DN11545_c0_g1_i5:216-686(+)
MLPSLGSQLSSMHHTTQPGRSGFARSHSQLFLAAKHDDFNLVSSLIFNGCPVELRDHVGNTALHVAAMAGHLATVERLVYSGADPNAVNRKGLNAGQLAQMWNRGAVAQFLAGFTPGAQPMNWKPPPRRPAPTSPFYAYRVTADDIGSGPTYYTQR